MTEHVKRDISSSPRNLRLVGGPWDGDVLQFQSWQTYVVAPDHTRGYEDDGQYVDQGDGTATWEQR